MSKGIITIVEDEPIVQAGLRRAIEDVVDPDLEIRCFNKVEEFQKFSLTEEFINVKLLIFDLANNIDELTKPGFSVNQYITENYNNNRVPIIIYSGYLDRFKGFENCGTVFKIAKGGSGARNIIELITLLYSTGFLKIFCVDGILEKEHPTNLHEVFTGQFRGNELLDILRILQTCHGDDCSERVVSVFQRIALRALVNKLNSATLINDTTTSPEVNVLEHFYRRTNLNAIPIWTGDILEHKSTLERVYIMRPKCDLERVSLDKTPNLKVLGCAVTPHHFPKPLTPLTLSPNDPDREKKLKEREELIKAREELIADSAKHNPKIGFNRLRVIPPSPFYPLTEKGKYAKGSAVDFSSPVTPTYRELAEDYNYLVTLSDDFVNEIATRFGAFIVRPGIVAIHDEELIAQVTPIPQAPRQAKAQ